MTPFGRHQLDTMTQLRNVS